jgi:trans-2,3-dihydro-3-hydroxyanthranilate isomerase
MTSAGSEHLEFHVVDVFTDRAYAGNPLAVVLDADGLTTAQMQAMAREFNLSETTFVQRPTVAGATYRLRIFTPGTELPFAGHPSVGTAWLLAHLGRVGPGEVVQECGAGSLPITVTEDGATLTGGAPTASDPVDAAAVLAAVGLSGTNPVTPVRWCGCGIDFAYVHVADDDVARAVPDAPRLAELGNAGVCVFSWASGRAHSRVFAGGVGVVEDPATGSAALGLAVFLVTSGVLHDGTSTFEVAQGLEVGRPSQLAVAVEAQGRTVSRATVTGGVVPVSSGRITAPAG